MNPYREMKSRHQAAVNAFPFFFAFTEEQFQEGMAGLGLSPEDTDKIYKFGDTGGFYRKTDADALWGMLERQKKELTEAIAGDKTGNGFIFRMFMYELGNHEYTYTGSTEDTLDALGYTDEDIAGNPALQHGLQKACKAQWALARKQN